MYWSIMTQSKLTNKTMVKIMMTVTNFGFVYSIVMMTVFLRNKFFQMMKRVE